MTNDTKQHYLDCLAQYKLVSSVKSEVEYFLKGLNELIPDSLLSIFDENELEVSKIHFFFLKKYIYKETNDKKFFNKLI